MAEEEVAAAEEEEEGRWEWEAFSKEVCQSYAQLEMVQPVVRWADPPCGLRGPGPRPLAPPPAAPPRPPRPTSPLHRSTSAPNGPRSPTSPAPPAAAPAG